MRICVCQFGCVSYYKYNYLVPRYLLNALINLSLSFFLQSEMFWVYKPHYQ